MHSILDCSGFLARGTYFAFYHTLIGATQLTHFTSTPFVFGISEKIRLVLNEAGVRVAIQPIHIIGQVLLSLKDPHTPEEMTCSIYSDP